MIKGIGKVTLFVNNQQEAVDFWTQKVGFIIKLEQPMGPGMKWVEVGPNESAFTTFVLYEKEVMLKQNPNANVGHPNVMLSTQDIEATYNTFSKNGVEVKELMVMPYGKMFLFKDQDGNEILVREDR